MKIDRLLSIIVILLNNDRITAKELSKRFEVSIRTIYRDIDAINLAGIPVISLQGNDGGFSIMENFTLKRHLFTFENMMGVIAALKGINTAIGDKTIDSTIEKFRNMLPESAKDSVDTCSEEIIIDVMPWGRRKDIQPLYKKMYAAIRDRLIVQFSYKDYELNESVRTVEPMSLVYKGYAWYVFAFCRIRNDYRIFKLSRITNCCVTDETFVRREMRYMPDEPQMQQTLVLTLRFPKKMRDRFEDYFDEECFKEDADGKVILEAPMPDEPWLYKMILSFDDDVEVLSPPSVRKKIAEIAQNIAKRYQT
jgi:predicted DNA-binding transcriptional regulator YafY